MQNLQSLCICICHVMPELMMIPNNHFVRDCDAYSILKMKMKHFTVFMHHPVVESDSWFRAVILWRVFLFRRLCLLSDNELQCFSRIDLLLIYISQFIGCEDRLRNGASRVGCVDVTPHSLTHSVARPLLLIGQKDTQKDSGNWQC